MCSSCSTSTLQNFNPVDSVFSQIFHILLFYIIFFVHNVTSQVINLHNAKSCVTRQTRMHNKTDNKILHNKRDAILHHIESSSKWANKKFRVIYTYRSISIGDILTQHWLYAQVTAVADVLKFCDAFYFWF